MTPADLRAWRDRNGLRQADLADLLGVHAMTVSRWERGTQKIPPYLLLALERLDRMVERACVEIEQALMDWKVVADKRAGEVPWERVKDRLNARVLRLLRATTEEEHG